MDSLTHSCCAVLCCAVGCDGSCVSRSLPALCQRQVMDIVLYHSTAQYSSVVLVVVVMVQSQGMR